jgi:hypothetical protein
MPVLPLSGTVSCLDGLIRLPDQNANRKESIMANLTVTEKEHWKERIARRIDKRIEVLTISDPCLINCLRDQARQRALQSLGLAEMQAELDVIEQQKEDLERREKNVHRAMLATIRRVPLEQVDTYLSYQHAEVASAIQRRQAVHEEELLSEDAMGQEILRLRREKDNLLDTVWLATSPLQVRELWQKVVELLGDEQTPLQKEALAIGAIEKD